MSVFMFCIFYYYLESRQGSLNKFTLYVLRHQSVIIEYIVDIYHPERGEVSGLYHHAGDLIEYFVDIYHSERGEVPGLYHHAGDLIEYIVDIYHPERGDVPCLYHPLF